MVAFGNSPLLGAVAITYAFTASAMLNSLIRTFAEVEQVMNAVERVRLWVDDASALQWMVPEGCPGVELRAWGSPPPGPEEPAPDVMLEAFGCDIAPEFIAYSAYQSSTRGQKHPKPVWINLEYLSAESYVERHHKLSSLLSSGPGAGWTRWFFYPGFTPGTGGLLRERPTWGALLGGAISILGLAILLGQGDPARLLTQGIHIGSVYMLLSAAS